MSTGQHYKLIDQSSLILREQMAPKIQSICIYSLFSENPILYTLLSLIHQKQHHTSGLQIPTVAEKIGGSHRSMKTIQHKFNLGISKLGQN